MATNRVKKPQTNKKSKFTPRVFWWSFAGCVIVYHFAFEKEIPKENTLKIAVIQTDSSFVVTSNEEQLLRYLNLDVTYDNTLYMCRITELAPGETTEVKFKYFDSGYSRLSAKPSSLEANCSEVRNRDNLYFFQKF